LCISCSLHHFIVCNLFGFKFEFNFHVQIQKQLLSFFLFPSLSFLPFGPSPTGSFPLSLSPLLSLPLQPGPRPFSSSSFSLPHARVAHFPVPAQLLRARPLSFFPSVFFPRARTAHQPLTRPIGAPLPPLLSLSLPGTWVPLVGPSFPAPNRDSAPSPTPPRDPRRRIRLGPARPGVLGRPYLSRRTPAPCPQAAAALRPNPSHRILRRRLGRSRLGPPPHLRSFAPRRRTTTAGAPRRGEDVSRPSPSLPPALPRPHGLAGVSEPPLAAARPLQPSSPPLNPLDRFLASRSIFPTKPRSKPRPGTRYRVSPVKSGQAPSFGPPAACPAAARRFPPPRPHRRIGIRRPRIDLTRESIRPSTGQPWQLCSWALKFSRNQPAVLSSSKVFAFRSYFFCLGPCSFSKSNPPSYIPRFSILTPLSRVYL
jgi:hypothetical protein